MISIFFRKPTFQRHILTKLLFLCLVPLLVACQPSNEGIYSGYLYFTQGSYLMRFSMRDSSLEAVTQLGDTKIREISDFGEGRLLISGTASVNRKSVARISWLELRTGQERALYSGIHARYIASADAIVYDDGGRLYAITQQDGTEVTSHVMSHDRHQLSALVEVSDGRLLIEILDNGVPAIYSYRAEDGTLISLDQLAQLCRLKGAVWMGDLDQLACIERNSDEPGTNGDYIFADLNGRILSMPSLPDGEAFLALTYISDQGALVLKESWRGQIGGLEKSAVWVHDVRSGENLELSDAVNLGSSVVYTRY